MLRNSIIAVAASAVIVSSGFLAWNTGATSGRERLTGNAISLDPNDANSYLFFIPIPEKTKKRIPQFDPATMLHVEEVKPNLFYVTDGNYQSAFLRVCPETLDRIA